MKTTDIPHQHWLINILGKGELLKREQPEWFISRGEVTWKGIAWRELMNSLHGGGNVQLIFRDSSGEEVFQSYGHSAADEILLHFLEYIPNFDHNMNYELKLAKLFRDLHGVRSLLHTIDLFPILPSYADQDDIDMIIEITILEDAITLALD